MSNYLHARFTDFLVNGVQYAGNRPPHFAIGEGRITPRVQTHYETSSYLAFTNYGHQRQDSYTKTDLMLTSASASGLFGAYTFQLDDPRTFGVRTTINF